MGSVRRAVTIMVVGCAATMSVAADIDPLARWRGMIAEASLRFGVPQRWIADVMRAESGGRTALDGRPIRSPAGAIGLMQLMPGTWADMRFANHLGADPDDPHDNIMAGAAYLRGLYDRFGYPGLFAAYNAGPARYGLSLAGGRALPNETASYLRAVTGMALPRRPAAAAPPSLFFPVGTQAPRGDREAPSLFIALSPSSPKR